MKQIECYKCKKHLKWKKPYKAGDRPVELDGRVHECQDQNKLYESHISCEFCPKGKVKGTEREIKGHQKLYHPNNEVFSLEYWSLRFLNRRVKTSKKKKSD